LAADGHDDLDPSKMKLSVAEEKKERTKKRQTAPRPAKRGYCKGGADEVSLSIKQDGRYVRYR
jgi:hypothetical protein